MQYLLLIHDDEKGFWALPEEEKGSIFQEYGAVTEALRDGGAYVGGNQLQPTSSAVTVRVDDGERVVTDGPFAETKEQLGGYYLIETDSLDEALGWAAKIPSARFGSIEVRPLFAPASTGEGAGGPGRYLLLFYGDPERMANRSDEEQAAIVAEYTALADELREGGRYLAGAPLQPTETATTVRVRDDEAVMTDGPFAETKEQLGGFFLIEAASLEEASAWAGRVPVARYGSVEVRPVVAARVEAAA